MKSSSFLCGVLVGAFGLMWASKRKEGLLNAQKGMMSLTNLTRGKGSEFTSGSQHSTSSSSTRTADNHTHQADMKESNLKMIKEFIKGNPEVKREVEQILKDTHTTIPGL